MSWSEDVIQVANYLPSVYETLIPFLETNKSVCGGAYIQSKHSGESLVLWVFCLAPWVQDQAWLHKTLIKTNRQRDRQKSAYFNIQIEVNI